MTLHITITEQTLLCQLLQKYLPGQEVRVFGSRVMGWPGSKGYKPTSDLDLAISGHPTPLALAELRADLDESDLPWRVDVCLLDELPASLRELALHQGVLLMPAPAAHRQVLVCVSGMSPAIVTETLYALVTQQDPPGSPYSPFVPDEIHVITTVDGKEKIVRELLAAETGMFHRFMRNHLPELPATAVRFDESTVHVISQVAKAGKALSDITTDDDNRAAANTIYSVLRKLKSQPGTKLHASVAGGRKSMSFYMGHAFSLVAEAEDRLSHVLVNEPFENPALKFYFPPRQVQTYRWQGRDGTAQSITSDQAKVRLAELSVLRLGGLLTGGLPPKALEDFDFAVRLAQAAIEPPAVRVVLERHKGRLEILGELIPLPPQQFLIFALYAMACKHQAELPNGAELIPEDLPAEVFKKMSFEPGSTPTFKQVRSKIQKAIAEVLGSAVARHFQIEVVGTRQANHERPGMLRLPVQNITLVGLDTKWPILRNWLMQKAQTT